MMKTYSDLEEELSELRRRKNLIGMHDHSNVRLYHARRKYLNAKIDSLTRRLNPYTIHCVAALGYPTTQTVASYKSTEISCMPVSYELEYETVKVLTVDGV